MGAKAYVKKFHEGGSLQGQFDNTGFAVVEAHYYNVDIGSLFSS